MNMIKVTNQDGVESRYSDAATARANGVSEDVIAWCENVNKWHAVRTKRDRLINAVNGYYLRHERELRMGKKPDDTETPTSLTAEQLAKLDQYVQVLADIPQTYSNPEDVVWPQKPALPQPAA